MTVDPRPTAHVAAPRVQIVPIDTESGAVQVTVPITAPSMVETPVVPPEPVTGRSPVQVAAPIPTLRDELAIARMDADARSRLAQAEMLLAEARLQCAQMIDDARNEAHTIISDARAAAQRMHTEALLRQTGTAEPAASARSSSTFSDLWDRAGEDHDVDDFFLTIPQRAATEVFNA